MACSDLDLKRSFWLLCDKLTPGNGGPSRSWDTNKDTTKIVQTGNDCGLEMNNNREESSKKMEYVLMMKSSKLVSGLNGGMKEKEDVRIRFLAQLTQCIVVQWDGQLRWGNSGSETR